MTDTSKHRQTLREVLKSLTPAEIARIMLEESQAALHEEELVKPHALANFRLPDDEWADLRQHLLDGGGITDDSCPSKAGKSLTTIVLQAIWDSDQATFWQELPHLVKMWMNHRKLISRDGSRVTLTGIGSAEMADHLKAAFTKPKETKDVGV